VSPSTSLHEHISSSLSSVGQSLYQTLKLPLPGQTPWDKTPLLIYGGSTATGALAIQYAKLSGATVIATCSPHSFAYVKSLGAGTPPSIFPPSS
jgi:NADPH:quinone reductase-like Zn-dependent oxidoreductase